MFFCEKLSRIYFFNLVLSNGFIYTKEMEDGERTCSDKWIIVHIVMPTIIVNISNVYD